MESLKFKRVFRGYDPEGVDKVIAEIQQNLAETEASNRELLLQVNSLNEFNTKWEDRVKSYQEREQDLREAILSAQRIADQVKKESELEAETQIKNAKIEAETILKNAEIEVTRLNDDIPALTQKKSELESQVETVSDQLEMLYNRERQSEQRIAEIKQEEQQAQASVTHLQESISELMLVREDLQSRIEKSFAQLEILRQILEGQAEQGESGLEEYPEIPEPALAET